jgi:hypothetical protein
VADKLSTAWQNGVSDLIIGIEDIRAFYRIIPVRPCDPMTRLKKAFEQRSKVAVGLDSLMLEPKTPEC